MCSICMSNPCNSRCPNAEVIMPVYICTKCKEGVFEGEKYYPHGINVICETCMDDMSVEELLALFEEKLEVA